MSLVSIEEQIDHMRMTICANPPVEISFLAAEMIWGRKFKEGVTLEDLTKFIGFYQKASARLYTEHWLRVYEEWFKAREQRETRAAIEAAAPVLKDYVDFLRANI